MARWFRFYADAMRHPKVAKLSDKDFRLWCDLLCVASERDGYIPPLDDLKHILKRRLDHLSTGVERLISARLITPLTDGYAPHGWDEKQYKSDISTDRVKRHRSKRNVSETPSDTEADTETETEEIKSSQGYVFAGRVIRLTAADLEKWERRYSGVGDIRAELGALDDWLMGQEPSQRKKWFHIVSGALNKKHQAAAKKERDEDGWELPIC